MNFENIVRRFVTWGIFLIPFIPIIVSANLFFPFITGKNFAFRILVELLFGGWFILMLYDKSYRPSFSWLLASIAGFVGIIALADIFGENPLKSIWSNFERMEGLVTLIHLFLYFIVAGTVLNSEKLWTRFLNTSVGVSAFLGIYGLFQLAGFITINQGGIRLDATFGNTTYLSIYMFFHVFITALLLLRWKGGNVVRYVYTGLIALQVVMIYFTATRGTILGLLGGVSLTALLIGIFGGSENKTLRKISAGVIVTILIIIGGFLLIKDSQFVKDSQVLARFSSISFSESAVNARFIVWETAFKGIKERPLLGWGQSNYNYVFNKYYNPELHGQEAWFDRAHNIVLDWLVAGGILGLLAYASIPIFFLYYLWRRDSRVHFSVAERSLWTALLAAYFFHNLFVFDNITSYILFFSMLAYIHTTVAKPLRDGHTLMQSIDSGIAHRLLAPLIIVAVVFGVYALNWKGIATSQTLIQALTPQNDLSVTLENFRSAAAYDALGRQEVAEQITQFSVGIARTDIDLSVKQAYLDLGVQELLEELERAPDDARLAIFLGSHLSRFGQCDEGLQFTERAHELSPEKQSILFELGINRLNSGDVDAALLFFKQAYELFPAYDQARMLYASTAIFNGEFALAEQLLVERFGTLAVPDTQLINAYVSINRYDLARDAWLVRIKNRPEDQQARLSLAAVYLALQEEALAIETIEDAILINPDFKEQGEVFIREIQAGMVSETNNQE